jgi:DNA-binding Lrp family transcriptional regulator
MKGFMPSDLKNGNGLLDATNRELLRLLLADPRKAVSELARQVGMSGPAVRERLARLEEAGVIRGYRLDLDPKALGLPVTAIVRVRPAPPRHWRGLSGAALATRCDRESRQGARPLSRVRQYDDGDHPIDAGAAAAATATGLGRVFGSAERRAF